MVTKQEIFDKAEKAVDYMVDSMNEKSKGLGGRCQADVCQDEKPSNHSIQRFKATFFVNMSYMDVKNMSVDEIAQEVKKSIQDWLTGW